LVGKEFYHDPNGPDPTPELPEVKPDHALVRRGYHLEHLC
jgi:hypothetical protein